MHFILQNKRHLSLNGIAAYLLILTGERWKPRAFFLSLFNLPFFLIWQAFERSLDSRCGWLKAIRKKQQKKRWFHNSSGSNLVFPSWHCTGVARRYCEPRTLLQTNPFSFFCQGHMRSPLAWICVTLYFYLLWKEPVTLDTVSTHAFRLLSFRVKGFLCNLHECVFQEISAISSPPTSI